MTTTRQADETVSAGGTSDAKDDAEDHADIPCGPGPGVDTTRDRAAPRSNQDSGSDPHSNCSTDESVAADYISLVGNFGTLLWDRWSTTGKLVTLESRLAARSLAVIAVCSLGITLFAALTLLGLEVGLVLLMVEAGASPLLGIATAVLLNFLAVFVLYEQVVKLSRDLKFEKSREALAGSKNTSSEGNSADGPHNANVPANNPEHSGKQMPGRPRTEQYGEGPRSDGVSRA